MTKGNPGGSVAVLGVDVPVGAAASEPATVGSADERFEREPTDAEGRWAVQAVVRHASARATRLRAEPFVTAPPALRRAPAPRDVTGKPESRCSAPLPGAEPPEATPCTY